MPTYPALSTGAPAPMVTPVAGTAKTAGVVQLLSWTVPNDGKRHSFLISTLTVASVNEIGGEITATFLLNGVSRTIIVDFGGNSAGFSNATTNGAQCDPNQTVTIQTTALTGGASVCWATLWTDL